MSLADAFAPVMMLNRDIVMKQTWGHLMPETGRKYHCFIVVAKGNCGDSIIFDYGFEGLLDSPWLFEDFTTFAFNSTSRFEASALYRFDGWYKKFKNGNYRFGGGKFTKIF